MDENVEVVKNISEQIEKKCTSGRLLWLSNTCRLLAKDLRTFNEFESEAKELEHIANIATATANRLRSKNHET